MKKAKDVLAKVGGCKNCPPVVTNVSKDNKRKINVSNRNGK